MMYLMIDDPYLDPSDNKCSLEFNPANEVQHKSALDNNQKKWTKSIQKDLKHVLKIKRVYVCFLLKSGAV